MSSATELIAAIAATKHTLFNQIQRLSDYESKLERLLVDVNTTPEGRARNRRTEIIMAPRLDKLFKMLEESKVQ